MITDFPHYIKSTLSSRLFEIAYKRIFSSIELGANGYQYNKHALIKLPLKPSKVDRRLTDNDIYNIYGLTDAEIEFIEFQYNQ